MISAEGTKIGIVGAGGVGTAIAYAALIRQSARTVALYDVNTAKVDAEVLDLGHGGQFTGSSQVIGGDNPEVLAGSDVVIITAGAKQNPGGETRLELAGRNVGLLEAMLPTLIAQAPNAVFVLVTNPCDILTVAALGISGLPASRVISSGTVLDSSRLRWLLGRRANLAVSSVHAYIVGEHGDSEFSVWSQARLGPVPILDWVGEDGQRFTLDELERITDDVRTAAYRVIEGKGATNYAIGLSATRIAEAILQDERAILPVSSVHRDYRGIGGVALSVPTVVGAGGVHQVLDLPLSPGEDAQLTASAAALLAAQASLGL